MGSIRRTSPSNPVIPHAALAEMRDPETWLGCFKNTVPSFRKVAHQVRDDRLEGGAVRREMGEVFGTNLARGAVSALANAATRSALDGSNFGDNIIASIPDVIGQAIGTELGGAIDTALNKLDSGGANDSNSTIEMVHEHVRAEQPTAVANAINRSVTTSPVMDEWGALNIGDSIAVEEVPESIKYANALGPLGSIEVSELGPIKAVPTPRLKPGKVPVPTLKVLTKPEKEYGPVYESDGWDVTPQDYLEEVPILDLDVTDDSKSIWQKLEHFIFAGGYHDGDGVTYVNIDGNFTAGDNGKDLSLGLGMETVDGWIPSGFSLFGTTALPNFDRENREAVFPYEVQTKGVETSVGINVGGIYGGFEYLNGFSTTTSISLGKVGASVITPVEDDQALFVLPTEQYETVKTHAPGSGLEYGYGSGGGGSQGVVFNFSLLTLRFPWSPGYEKYGIVHFGNN